MKVNFVYSPKTVQYESCESVHFLGLKASSLFRVHLLTRFYPHIGRFISFYSFVVSCIFVPPTKTAKSATNIKRHGQLFCNVGGQISRAKVAIE